MSWPTRRQRDGGIDEVPLPASVPGRLWLCGKHAIGPDRERAIAEVGGRAVVVCLTEAHELAERYPDYLAWLRSEDGIGAVWWPIPDLHAPDVAAASTFVDELAGRLHAGEVLLMHCAAGIGRTGTIATCVLVRLGQPVTVARAVVAAARPGAGPEVGAQADLVATLAAARPGATGRDIPPRAAG